jgi:hypothetical protein
MNPSKDGLAPDAARAELPARAWMRLPSGRRLDLMAPAPDGWTDEDLAIRLARTFRWGGESRWPRPLSVAQHSLTVLALVRQWTPAALSRAESLRELLHDAEEAFLGFDCISPLKRALGQPFADVSERLSAAVQQRYALPDWTATAHALHKRADVLAAATEAVHVVGWSRTEIAEVLRIAEPPLDSDPLAAAYSCEPWEPWSVDVAAERFLGALQR